MKTRSRTKLSLRRNSRRLGFDTLEDRLSLGDAVIGTALGLNALGSPNLGPSQPSETAVVNGSAGSTAQHDSSVAEVTQPSAFSTTSVTAPVSLSGTQRTLGHQITTTDQPLGDLDEGKPAAEGLPSSTAGVQGAKSGGIGSDGLSGAGFSFSSSGGAGQSSPGSPKGLATSDAATGKLDSSLAGNRGVITRSSTPAAPPPAPSAPPSSSEAGDPPGEGKVDPGAAPDPAGEVKPNINANQSAEAEQLRQLLRNGDKYDPTDPNAEADLELRVQEILESRQENANINNGGLVNSPGANEALNPETPPPPPGGGPPGGGDPGAPGTFAVTVEEYNFGNTATDPVSIAGTGRVELTAQVIAPTVLTGQRPVLVFMHGNHSATYNPTTGGSAFSWPPAAGFESLPNYRGYEYVARNLASHGYVVVSISVNGTNVLGGTNMVPRAELMHRHLEILRDLNATGDVIQEPGETLTGDLSPFDTRFVGHLDMTNIGTMGHSRGGDGVVAHFQYETGVALAPLPVLPVGERFPIKAVLPLAPVDFNARTINNVPLLVMLPYNDGDVSDLQGQRFYDRARYNLAGDAANHHVITILGASHNSYNTIWFSEVGFPGRFVPGSFDDGSGTPRISPAEQRSTALAHFGAFFRTYVGNSVQPVQQQFIRNLTGDAPLSPTIITPASPVLAGGNFHQFHPADTVATRRDVNRLLNAAALTTNQLGGAVTSSGVTAAFSTAGLQAVGSASLTWTASGGFWQNAIPAASADVSRYSHLQFRVSNLSTTLQNFSIVLTDGTGATASTTVNAHYSTPPDSSRRSPLYVRTTITPTRSVMNTAAIPLSAFGGVNLTDVRSIRLVFDQTPSGQVLVNDLMFATRTVGFQVTASTPASGAVVTAPPTTFAITFSDPYDPATLNASDLTVNGIAATSVSPTSATTATFTFASSPVTMQGPQTMSIAAGALTRLSDGELLGAFTSTFRFDLVPLTVTSTVPAVGSSIPLPFTQLDVNFSEAVNPSSVGTSDLTLSQGTVTAATPLNADTVRYTLSGITTEGTLTVTIPAGALTDAFGNPSVAFTGNYFLDIGAVPFPPVMSENPAGSLIYTSTATGLIGPGDTDSFTININAGQTIAVVVTPTSPSLRPVVTLRNPSGAVVASATAAAAGQAVATSPVPGGSGGTFTVEVAGAAGTTGNFSAQVILNADLEAERFGGPSNDTPATAQALSFLSLSSNASRAAVLGRTSGTSTAHPVWAGIPNPVTLTQNGTIGVSTLGLNATGTGQIIGRYANNEGALIVGNSGRTFLNGFMPYLAGTTVGTNFARNEISLALTGVTSPRVLYFSDVSPAGTDPYLAALTSLGITPTVVPQSTTTAPDTYPQFVTQVQSGNFDLVIFQQRFWSDGGIAFGYITPLVNHINNGGRAIWSSWVRTQIFAQISPLYTAFGGATTGNANQLVVNQAASFTVLPDYYAFQLTAGESATLALQSTGSVNFELRGPTDTVLAAGRSGPANFSQVISNFVAPATGTYFARITGAQLDVPYTLVVTRNAAFDTEPNGEFLSQASQPLGPPVGGVQSALGHIIGGGGGVSTTARVLYFSDVSPAGTDPYLAALTSLGITPTVVPQSSTAAPDTYPTFATQLSTGAWDLVIFQQRFWFDASVITPMVNYINGGGRFLWSTWNRTQVFAAMAPVFTAFGAGTTGGANQTVLTQITSPIWTGIPNPVTFTLDGGLGVSTLGLTATAAGTPLGRWANNEVAVVSANSGRTLLTGYMPYLAGSTIATTLAQNEISTILGGISDVDIYQARAAAGSVLTIDTDTPLTGPGQPGNALDPAIRVYAPDGRLVAMDDNSDSDGRNARLSYTVPAGEGGMYFIEVRASDATPSPTKGEYILHVQAITDDGLPAFEVTSTTPLDKAVLLTPPTTITVNFNTNILFSSLNASDLQVDGVPATAFQILSGNQVQFTLPGGLSQGLHFVTIDAGAILATDGTPVTNYVGRFTLDSIGPRVIASSIQEGDVLGTGSLTYTVQFDELLNQARVVPAAFTLRGVDRAINHNPASFNYDTGTSTLTITYTNLLEDRYTLTLISGNPTGLVDVVGNGLDGETVVGGVSVFPIPPGRSGNGVPGGNFVVNFVMDVSSAAFPVPLTQLAPQGSLIYQGQVQAGIAPATDSDRYTLDVDAGQTISVLVTSAAGLRSTVEVRDPSGGLLGTATAPAAGQPALLQPVPAAVGGTYTITVRGVSGTGLYTAQVTLNAAYEAESNGGSSNDTLATAQTLTGFTALPKGADRAAVRGRTDLAPAPPGPSTATAVTPTFEDIGTTGTVLTALQGADDATTQITTAQLAGFTFPFFGTTFNTLFVSSNGLITFGGGDATFTNTDLTTVPAVATIAPYWDDFLIPAAVADGSVRFQVIGTGAAQHLVVQWTNVTFFGGGSSGLTFQAVLNLNGTMQFNYMDLNGGLAGSDEGASATVGIKAANPTGTNRLLIHFNQPGPTALVGSNRSTHLTAAMGVPPAPAPFTAAAVTPVVFENIATTGTVLTALQGVDDAATQITTAQLSGFTFPFFGTTFNTLFVSSNGLITFGAGDATFGNTDLTTVPAVATIAPLWDDYLIPAAVADGSVRFQVIGTGAAQHLVVQWTNVTFFGGGSSGLTFQAVLNLDGSMQFNYLDLNGGLVGSDEGGSSTVGVKAAGAQGPNRLLVHFNQVGPTALVGSNRSTRLTPAVVPPPAPLPADFYSVSLTAGQTITLGVTGTNVLLELQDSGGMVVATGMAGATNLSRVINNFRATTAGTYFAVVRGAAGTTGVDYSLVVTRNADFDREANNTSATAQDITGTVGALGHVVGGGGSTAGARVLYFSDVSAAGTDPYLAALTSLGITPTVVPQSTTTSPATYPQFVTQLTAGGWDLVIFQQRFWSDGGIAFGYVAPFVNYINSGGRAIWSSWVRTQIFAQIAPLYTAFGAGTTGNANQTVLTQISSPIWTGIPDPLTFTLDGGLGVSSTGLTAPSGTALGRWANNEIAVVSGNGGRTLLTGYMPYLAGGSATTLAQNEIATVLGGVSDEDWYRVEATPGQQLMFDTSTPGDGAGEFVNTLNPRIELFDPSGAPVGTHSVLADGRNEMILFTVPAGGGGTYRIRVSAEGGTRGEYFLDPIDLAAAGTDGAALAALPTGVLSLDSSSASGNLDGVNLEPLSITPPATLNGSQNGLAFAVVNLDESLSSLATFSTNLPTGQLDKAVWAGTTSKRSVSFNGASSNPVVETELDRHTVDDLFAEIGDDDLKDDLIEMLA